MHSLSEIDAHISQAGEQRIPVDATHTPGDGGNMFIISAPGSYYLPSSINVTSNINGISIRASFVKVDLNGNNLNAPIGNPKKAIEIVGDLIGITICNGTISNWTDNPAVGGVPTGSEFYKLIFLNNKHFALGAAGNNRVLDCTFAGNGGGVSVGDRCVIARCIASQNATGDGFSGGNNCVVIDCTSNDNLGTGSALSLSGNGFRFGAGGSFQHCSAANNNAGFEVGSDSSFENCTATGNVFGISTQARSTLLNCVANDSANGGGVAGSGISTGVSCSLTNCAASANGLHGISVDHASTVVNCSAKDNGGNGITTGDGCTVSGCSARNNHLNGIEIKSSCLAEGNTLQANASSSSANGNHYYGLVATGGGNRIEANHSSHHIGTGSGGIAAPAVNGNNLVIRNSAYANTGGNYIIASGNIVGPSVNAATIGSNNNPHANYDY